MVKQNPLPADNFKYRQQMQRVVDVLVIFRYNSISSSD